MTGFALASEPRARRLLVWAVLAGGLVGLLISLLTADWQRATLFDAWQRAAPREIADDRIAVVLIDSLSLDAVGPWPWPRYYMARLAETVAAQGPRAIGFDIVFAEPDALNPATFAALFPELDAATAARIGSLPTMDSVLAQVLGSAPVVMARLGVGRNGVDPAGLLVDPPVAGQPPPETLRVPQVLTSIPQLDDFALGHAMLNGPPDGDGIVRRVPLSIVAGNRPMPGLAVELARVGMGAGGLAWRNGRLQVGPVQLPADATGSLPIRFGHVPERAVFSAAEVLGGKVRPDAFAGKVVLIGLGAEGAADIVATPLETEIFGVLVQAQAVDAIMRGGWLARPGWVVGTEAAASLALVLAILLAAGTRRYWLLWPAMVFALALPFASFLAFDRANLLFDPTRPLLVGAGALVAMWAVLYVRGRTERARMAAQLVEQRVTAAEQEGELNAARRIQLGMVPGSERLARLDPRVELGAVLRPARSVGGDFYDALMVGPDTLLFVIGDVTGKGVPAALFMALSKALSKSVLSRAGDDLGRAVAELNRDLMAEADEEMGVTMLVGRLNCKTGHLALVSAGHENPLLVASSGKIAAIALRGGPPLCVVDFPYTEECVQLAPQDTLILLTDGVTEAQNASQTLFGADRLIAALQGGQVMPVQDRVIELADHIRAFEGNTEPSDDLTIDSL